MKDWRDHFAEQMRLYRQHGAGNQRYETRDTYEMSAQSGCLRRMVEAVRREAFERGPDDMTVRRALNGRELVSEILHDAEKMHFVQSATRDMLAFWDARGDHTYLRGWIESDKIRFVRGIPQTVVGHEARP